MNGLFEPEPSRKKVKKEQPKSSQRAAKEQNVGSRLIDESESRSRIVKLASAVGSGDFMDVDVTKAKRASATKKEIGRIIPTVNYISDEASDG